MSIFSKIKTSKKAADEHKAAEAAKVAAEAAVKSESKPYHHRPRHAAQDALAGTPGVADRAAILEANQARAMYAKHSFYSTSSPSLVRSYSSASLVNGAAASSGMHSATHSASHSRQMSRSSSHAGLALAGPRLDRRAHPGYHSYQNGTAPSSPARSRRGSGPKPYQTKSPLSSEPITPMDSSASSSSSASSFSTRGYNDPIEPTIPMSQRLEEGAVEKAAPRVSLYAPKTGAQLKPWEVAAQKKAARNGKQPESEVAEIQVAAPEPVAKPAHRSRFLSFGKQHAVAAC